MNNKQGRTVSARLAASPLPSPRSHVALTVTLRVTLTVTLACLLVLRSSSRILEEKGNFLQSTLDITTARSIRLGIDPGITRCEIFP